MINLTHKKRQYLLPVQIRNKHLSLTDLNTLHITYIINIEMYITSKSPQFSSMHIYEGGGTRRDGGTNEGNGMTTEGDGEKKEE